MLDDSIARLRWAHSAAVASALGRLFAACDDANAVYEVLLDDDDDDDDDNVSLERTEEPCSVALS